MITFKFNKLGLGYKKYTYNENWTIFQVNVSGSNDFCIDIQLKKAQNNQNNMWIQWGEGPENSSLSTNTISLGYLEPIINKNAVSENLWNYYQAQFNQILPTDTPVTGIIPQDKPSILSTYSHTYRQPGRYLVKLKNVTNFKTNSNAPFITGVYQLGKPLETCADAFANNLNLDYLNTQLRIPEKVKDCSNMFKKCTGLRFLPEYLFYFQVNTELAESEYNELTYPKKLTQLQNCSGMFYGCSNLELLKEDFCLPDSINNIDMMFEGCTKLSTLRKMFQYSIILYRYCYTCF